MSNIKELRLELKVENEYLQTVLSSDPIFDDDETLNIIEKSLRLIKAIKTNIAYKTK